jgi:hypothetical protein
VKGTHIKSSEDCVAKQPKRFQKNKRRVLKASSE